MKKAQGISINVIIIAAIALLVLVILSVIFIGQFGLFGSKVGDCQNKGGKCISTDYQCGDPEQAKNYPVPIDWTCPENQRCCVAVQK